MADHLFAASNWWSSPLMMGGFLYSIQGYIRALREVAPEFGDLRLVTPTTGPVRVEVDHPDFLLQMLQLTFDPRNRYSSTDSRGRPSMASTAPEGFTASFLCGPEGDERFSVRVCDGSRSAAAPIASATVKSLRDGDWPAEEVIEDALCASIAFWRPGTAWMTTNSFKAAVRIDPRDHLVVGWRTYLGRRGRSLPTLQLVTRSALPRGTLARIIPPGGVLVGLRSDFFEPSDPDQRSEAIAIRDGLRPHGLLDLPKDADTIGRGELVEVETANSWDLGDRPAPDERRP
ncbi:MAG: hypothetical protein ABSD62_03080 [Candidatus Limnocylindrales bacterium]